MKKTHTTIYRDAFIEIADDCKNIGGVLPPNKKEKTIAEYHYELIKNNPYYYTSDDIIFLTYAGRNKIKKSDFGKEREKFFSKGQACLRSSPLTKTYGWGIHSNSDGKVALYSADSKEYERFHIDKNIQHIKAMRNKRET